MLCRLQYILEADRSLRHIAPLKELRIDELAETVKCRHLESTFESPVGYLRQFVAGIGEGLLDNQHELLHRLDEALVWLDQHS